MYASIPSGPDESEASESGAQAPAAGVASSGWWVRTLAEPPTTPAEGQPGSLEVVTLDDQLTAAARREGFVVRGDARPAD
jgi:hypothetical protein